MAPAESVSDSPTRSARAGSTILLADLDEASLADAVEELSDAGIDAVAHTVDLRDGPAVDDMVARAAALGPLSTACLNAGVTSTGTNVWETPAESIQFVMDVNLGGLANSICAASSPC